MRNKLEYHVENEELIVDYYFNNQKASSINAGNIENILNKCKLYDEEYETLLKQNEYMKRISKDYKKSQQENQQLKEIIKENTILVKDEYGDYQECNINPLEMKQKYEKQVDNWNKLKEIAKSERGFKKQAGLKGGLWFEVDDLLDKMQELEGSDSDEQRDNC